MINKRLIGTVGESKKYIAGNVALQWLSLAANIGMIGMICRLLERLYLGTAEKVTFSYEDEVILDNLSLEVPENRIVGIVGKSGSGKSTLLKLFMRFWEVKDGEIRVSGRPADEINTANLRDMESFVTQETYLFHDSIRNNLRIARLDATDEEIESACRKASVHDFILTLPKGYDTPVGELGDTLSGGERQRLGMARAFLHDAPFLLLDEPTSNLDSLNEAVVLRSLREEGKGKTWKTKIRIMITVTLFMSIGFVMMHQVPVGRIVLACVWVFHVVYFLFGVRTFRPEEAAE